LTDKLEEEIVWSRKNSYEYIEGCICANDDNKSVEHDEFWDKFIDFIEVNGWHFGGGTKQIDAEGNEV
jgi:uncharacterized protein YggL (DUF469 family)